MKQKIIMPPPWSQITKKFKLDYLNMNGASWPISRYRREYNKLDGVQLHSVQGRVGVRAVELSLHVLDVVLLHLVNGYFQLKS